MHQLHASTLNNPTPITPPLEPIPHFERVPIAITSTTYTYVWSTQYRPTSPPVYKWTHSVPLVRRRSPSWEKGNNRPCIMYQSATRVYDAILANDGLPNAVIEVIE